tara:strand:- start:9208 stop:9588 length:381 start_codon:yes stop_codon:yes gene_type:complete
MKKIINTKLSPKPIGPYNQAILMNDTLYMSGQIGLDPKTMILNNKNLQDETTQVMLNIRNILIEANMSFDNVVKTTIFLTNMDYFNEVNKIYGSFLKEGNEPARETVAVKSLPMNVNVEISMIAIK